MIRILSIHFQPFVLAPNDFANIKANVKVASTENGIIFGNIVYDVAGSTSDRNVVVLNDIHIDIMDYIVPASCTETEFRSMWAEFEWENKVSVNTSLTDLENELMKLILDGSIGARIDSHNKVLLAQDVDQRSQIFSKAVDMCDMYQRRAKMLLLRSAILKANISVKVNKQAHDA